MYKTALKYGILIVAFIFLWTILEYLVGLYSDYVNFHPVATLLSLVVPLIFLYMGLREAQKENTGFFTYGEAFKTGLYITIVVAVLSPLLQWLIFTLAFPDVFISMKANTEAIYLAEGIDPVVAQRRVSGEYSLGSYLLNSFTGMVVAGVVMSAILAIFVRDKTLPKGG